MNSTAVVTKYRNLKYVPDGYVIPKDIAAHYGVNVTTVYRWIDKGWLSVTKIDNSKPDAKKHIPRYIITVNEFNRFDTLVSHLGHRLARFVPLVLYSTLYNNP